MQDASLPPPTPLLPFKPFWLGLLVIYWALEAPERMSLRNAFLQFLMSDGLQRLVQFKLLHLDRWLGPQAWLSVDSVRHLTGADPLTGQIAQPVFRPSIYSLAGLAGNGAVMAVHIVGLLLAVAFTAGLFTRLTSIATLVFVLSAIHRNPLITGPFEPVLVVLLIGLSIAPSGALVSLDRWRSGLSLCLSDDTHWTTTLGTRLMQVQISALFFMMAIAKMSASIDDGHTWWIGEGVWTVSYTHLTLPTNREV